MHFPSIDVAFLDKLQQYSEGKNKRSHGNKRGVFLALGWFVPCSIFSSKEESVHDYYISTYTYLYMYEKEHIFIRVLKEI